MYHQLLVQNKFLCVFLSGIDYQIIISVGKKQSVRKLAELCSIVLSTHMFLLWRESMHNLILRVPYPIQEKKNVSEGEAVRLYDEKEKKNIYSSLVSRSLVSALLDLRL